MKKFVICFITILFMFTNIARAQQSEVLESEIVLVSLFGFLTGAIAYKTLIKKDEETETETEEKVSLLDIPADEARIKPYWNLYNDGSDNKLETGIKFKF
ncbi:MAG: hypothetical protein K0U39_01695 [Alphaproteobacteria bacterium]|nr:hypothetical protein [Alphaproteobacteria bacterium]